MATEGTSIPPEPLTEGTKSDSGAHKSSLSYYLVGSFFLIGGLLAAAPHLAEFKLWQFMLLLLALMFLTATPACYHIIIKKTRASSAYTREGWLSWAVSHRWWKYILVFLAASVALFFMLMQLPVLGAMEWAFMALTCPVLYFLYRRLTRFFAKEIRHEWLVASFSLGASSLLAPLLVAAAYILCAVALSNVPAYDTFPQAVAAQASALENSTSALISAAAVWSNFFQGAQDYAIGRLGGFLPLLALLLSALGYAVIFFNVSLMMSFFLIPPRELKRILLPLQADTDLPPLPQVTIIVTTVVAVVCAWMIYMHGFIWLEQVAMDNRPAIVETRDKAVEVAQAAIDGVSIDGVLYGAEAIPALKEKAAARIAQLSSEAKDELRAAINRQFDRRCANVDSYLDWYYKLSSEYMRIAKMAFGEIEDYMKKQMKDKLEAGIDEREFDDISRRYGERIEDVKESLLSQLEAYRLPEGANVHVIQTIDLGSLQAMVLDSAFQADDDAFKTRMKLTGASGLAGLGVGGAVGLAIVTKVAQKTVFKLALKTALKLALGKGASALGGAGAGAALGSVVPGIGTLIGAGVGAIGGMIASDAALLNLDEHVNRDAFRQEIIDTIEEQRREALAALDG